MYELDTYNRCTYFHVRKANSIGRYHKSRIVYHPRRTNVFSKKSSLKNVTCIYCAVRGRENVRFRRTQGGLKSRCSRHRRGSGRTPCYDKTRRPRSACKQTPTMLYSCACRTRTQQCDADDRYCRTREKTVRLKYSRPSSRRATFAFRVQVSIIIVGRSLLSARAREARVVVTLARVYVIMTYV